MSTWLCLREANLIMTLAICGGLLRQFDGLGKPDFG